MEKRRHKEEMQGRQAISHAVYPAKDRVGGFIDFCSKWAYVSFVWLLFFSGWAYLFIGWE